MSRFSRLIDQLEDFDQQDVKNTAKVFAIAAHLYERLNQLAEPPEKSKAVLKPKTITREFLLETFGSYDEAYRAYQQAYGIKCRRSWGNLLKLVQDLQVPNVHSISTEERLKNLEEKVDLLMEILLNNVQKDRRVR
ncbi:hypothetical protein [[Limnothrix rosea] IAM M-220]|uniref:hypothetical protein n=1 Tax=[Limnothrix rosea] IAM M-220 TaxID=454133 RepID=UPI0009623E27|nr:hypothetical protein [[Limnothrix rosea] IAM M-220]OKH18630.1 hypothetical protein NIES208_05325 [[Limnothrix rosea] IAM M-220]